MSDKRSCVLLAGGYSHPFEETGSALEQMLVDGGWSVDRFSRPEPAIGALADDTDLFVINALYWSMSQHEKYQADRAQWAHHLADSDLAAMFKFVRTGGALLAIHTSVICWDTQPGWLDLLGGGWRWGRTHHPPMGEVQVRLTEMGRAISDGPDEFGLIDEVYHALDPLPDAEILAEGIAGGEPQPVAWLRPEGDGLVGVDALGHDGRSLNNPGHSGLLHGMLERIRSR